jgi:hypothetical protein
VDGSVDVPVPELILDVVLVGDVNTVVMALESLELDVIQGSEVVLCSMVTGSVDDCSSLLVDLAVVGLGLDELNDCWRVLVEEPASVVVAGTDDWTPLVGKPDVVGLRLEELDACWLLLPTIVVSMGVVLVDGAIPVVLACTIVPTFKAPKLPSSPA